MSRIVIGNWKMNLNLAEAVAIAQASAKIATTVPSLEVVVAPSLPWLTSCREAIRFMPPNFAIASQVVSREKEGAYTGDVSANQLKGLTKYCLVGHSERRRFHHESGAAISYQIKQLLANGIIPIVCFGEMSQSQSKTFSHQITLDLEKDLTGLDNWHDLNECFLAYEPLWAIGTGKVATPDYVAKVFEHLNRWYQDKTGDMGFFIYGGSVNEDNAASFRDISHIKGLLVGGASLHARSFGAVCRAFQPHV